MHDECECGLELPIETAMQYQAHCSCGRIYLLEWDYVYDGEDEWPILDGKELVLHPHEVNNAQR